MNQERIIENSAARMHTRASRLSVLVPFHKDDPTPLIAACAGARPDFDLTLIDDGSADIELLARVAEAIHRLAAPARIIVWPRNRGRSAARNRLIAAASANHVLFLDADMAPQGPGFMHAWLDFAARDPSIAFGGFTVDAAPRSRATSVHRAIAQSADCKPAAERAKSPARRVATSNLLVRRNILDAAPFDESFSGWGWEDVDWAMRAAAHGEIVHIDNPVTHTGLDCVSTLLRKYDQAGPNYRRLCTKHPEAAAFPSTRAARFMKRLPHRRARPLFASLARAPAPILLRSWALKLYRTSVYADHLP